MAHDYAKKAVEELIAAGVQTAGPGDYVYGITSSGGSGIRIVDNYDQNGDGVFDKMFQMWTYSTLMIVGAPSTASYDDAARRADFTGSCSAYASSVGYFPGSTFTAAVWFEGSSGFCSLSVTLSNGSKLLSVPKLRLPQLAASFAPWVKP